MKGVEFVYELPLVFHFEQGKIEKGSYEDFITYQTYNEHILEFLMQKKYSYS